MKTIKTSIVLKSFDGKNIPDGPGKDLTLGSVISAILGGKVSNPTLGWILGKKFATEKSVELKAEDVVFLKTELETNAKATDYGFGALVIGQIIEILESSEEPVEIKQDKKASK